ncbi:MAG: hypothetical protein HOC43_05000 [Planctomycetes bacterium]|jgi:hypothetical protein|nr:hypothetical protein [Planctomycetota bacterium]
MNSIKLVLTLLLLLPMRVSVTAAHPQVEKSEKTFASWQHRLEAGFFVQGTLVQTSSGIGPGEQGRLEYLGGIGRSIVFEWYRSGQGPSASLSSGHGFGFCEIYGESDFQGEWQCIGVAGVERLRNREAKIPADVVARDVSCSTIRFLPKSHS